MPFTEEKTHLYCEETDTMRIPGREMTWCSHCGKFGDTVYEYTSNTTSCVGCGKILFEGAYLESHQKPIWKGNIATTELIYKNIIDEVSHDTRFYKGRELIWCSHCVRNSGTSYEQTTGTIYCANCGKILFEDIFNQKDTFLRNVARGKDRRKLAVDAKSRKSVSYGKLPMKKQIPTKLSYGNGKEHAKKDLITVDKEDKEQDSCSYSDNYNYDYEGGDEYDG